MLDVKTRRNLSRHKSSFHDTRNKYKAESLSRHKISCCNTDYCNLENSIETLYEEVMLRQSDEFRDTRRQGFWS